jgi:hypothetical protein
MLRIILLGADKYWDSLAFASIRAVVVAATKPVESERNEGFALRTPRLRSCCSRQSATPLGDLPRVVVQSLPRTPGLAAERCSIEA